MKDKCLFFFAFITALSLLLAPLASQKQIEKVRADDYTTYIHPDPDISHAASGIAHYIADRPLEIFDFIITRRVIKRAITDDQYRYRAEILPIFLFCRKIVI